MRIKNIVKYIGAISWILSIQYFIVQVIVANAWKEPFSLKENPISDLGNTACGAYSERYVCSPLHDLMNLSFVLLGLTMILGSVFIARQFHIRHGVRSGFSLFAVAGFGTILVGMYPENTVASLHILGASLPFLFGNVAMILLADHLNLSKNLRIYTMASGVVGLSALILFMTGNTLGLGHGGMERLVAYPQTIWMIVFGVSLMLRHQKTK